MIKKMSKYYAARIQNKIAGVFSSPEKAPAEAELSEITPYHIEGSPHSEEYICMSKGIRSTVRYNGEKYVSEDFETEAMWGDNPQSAIAGLFGYGISHKSVVMTEFALYRVDEAYIGDDVDNLAKAAPFSDIATSVSEHLQILPEVVATDYIKLYIEKKQKQEERFEKRKMTKVSDSSSRLIRLKCLIIRQKENVWFCGTFLSSRRQWLEKYLLTKFSANELILLSEILTKVRGGSDSETIASIKSLNDEEKKLLEEALECVPPLGGKKRPY